MSNDELNMSDDQVAAMMNWQGHAGLWVISQGIALQQIAEREGMDLRGCDTLAAAVKLFELAREQEARNANDVQQA